MDSFMIGPGTLLVPLLSRGFPFRGLVTLRQTFVRRSHPSAFVLALAHWVCRKRQTGANSPGHSLGLEAEAVLKAGCPAMASISHETSGLAQEPEREHLQQHREQ